MKTGYKPIETAVEAWQNAREYEGHFNPDKILRIAHDGVSDMITDEQTRVQMSLIDVKGFVGKLPKGFVKASLVLCLKDGERKVERGQMVNWVYEKAGSDCQLEVNLLCPECHTQTCDHSSPVMVLEADRLFQQSHPEVFMQHWKYFGGGFGPKTDGFPPTTTHPSFEIMWPMTGSSNLWGAEYHLGTCVNARLPEIAGGKRYRLEPPEIITNVRNGQILLSYTAEVMDGRGLLMVPDITEAYTALVLYIDCKLMYTRWLGSLGQAEERAYLRLKELSDTAIAAARSRLQIPDETSWYRHLKENWTIENSEYYFAGD